MAFVPIKRGGKRRYGTWAGEPVGRAEDLTRCAASVRHQFMPASIQCNRKRGHGPKEAFCKQHAKTAREGDYS